MGSFFYGLSWIFPRLVDHSVEISLLIGLIFLVKFLAPKKLPPWWHYSLWLLLLVRMLVPLEFENQLSLFTVLPSVETPHVSEFISAPPAEMEMIVPPAGPKTETVDGDLRFLITKSIPVIWLTGSMILGVCILFESISFWRAVRRRPKVIDEDILALLAECKSRMKIKRKIDIVVTDNVRSPALFGYLWPRLLLPEGIFEKMDERDMSYAFMHELGHLKRHDIGVSWLVTILQVIHWFNPLVWLAFYQIRIDQESACDAAVLSRINPRQSGDYAKAIVGFLEKFCQNYQLPALAGILENRSQMKKRLARIVQYRKSSQKLSLAALSMLVVSGFALFTLTGVAAEKDLLSESVVEKSKDDSRALFAENGPVGTWGELDGLREADGPAAMGMATEVVAGPKGAYEKSPVPPAAFSEALPPNEASSQGRYVLNAVEEGGQKDMQREVPPVSLAGLAVPAAVVKPEPAVSDDSLSSEGPMPKSAAGPDSLEISRMAVESMQTNAPDVAPQTPPLHAQAQNREVPVPTSAMDLADGLVADFDVNSGPALDPKEDAAPAPSIPIDSGDRDDVPVEQYYVEAENVDLDEFTVAAEIEMLKETGKSLLKDKSATASRAPSVKDEADVDAGTFMAADVDTPPRVIKGFPPRYPYLAKRDDITGTIVLQFVVTKDGNAVGPKVVQSEPKGVFDETALQAIEQYRFKPGIKDGEAVDVRVNLPIKFDLS